MQKVACSSLVNLSWFLTISGWQENATDTATQSPPRWSLSSSGMMETCSPTSMECFDYGSCFVALFFFLFGYEWVVSPLCKIIVSLFISSMNSSQGFPNLNLGVSLQGLVQQNIPLSIIAVFSSITKLDSMSNLIKEGCLT
jgi:hypothetical protein